MYKTSFNRIFLIAILVICTFAILSKPAFAQTPGNMSPIRIQFDKQGGTNGIWNGTISGDVDGDLTTQLLSAQQSGPILHVTFIWIISADEHSFTAVLEGTLNTTNGQVEMDGTVVEGWLVGAQVHEAGQLVDPELGRFLGNITIFPATSD